MLRASATTSSGLLMLRVGKPLLVASSASAVVTSAASCSPLGTSWSSPSSFTKSMLSGPKRFNFQPVRYKSTDALSQDTLDTISEIQTQLPSVDDMVATSSTLLEQTSHAAGELSNHIGYLNSIGLAQTWYWPSDLIQHAMEYIHVYTGMPWWGTICTVTILVRLLMFPIYVKSSDTVARNSKIKPELDKVTKELMASTDMAESQRIAYRRRKLLQDNGIKNRWLAAPMIQLPIAIGFFNALRHMANFPVDGFAEQGILWFHDLTQADPYLGLQIITAAVLMTFSRIGGETGAQQFSGAMKRFFIIMPLLSIPATMKLASAVVLYFATNGMFSVAQTFLLRNKWVRKKLNIADVVNTATPSSATSKDSGIIASFKKNMNQSLDQAERRQKMLEQQKKLERETRARKLNANIKIVRRADFNKKL